MIYSPLTSTQTVYPYGGVSFAVHPNGFSFHCTRHGRRPLGSLIGSLSYLYEQVYFLAQKRLYKYVQDANSFLNELGTA
jgi:hypothetical protein